MTSLSRSCTTSRLEPWTDTHTQDNYRNLAAHARRGLMTNEGGTGGVFDLYRNQHGVFLEGQFLVDVLSDLDVSHGLRYPYHFF